jgi:hypothetical protein
MNSNAAFQKEQDEVNMGAVSDDENEEPTVPIQQRRRHRATVEMSPSAPADSTTKTAADSVDETTVSSRPSKHPRLAEESRAVPAKVFNKVTAGRSSTPTTQPPKAAKPRFLEILHHDARIARRRRRNA